MIAPEDIDLIRITDDPQEVIRIVREGSRRRRIDGGRDAGGCARYAAGIATSMTPSRIRTG